MLIFVFLISLYLRFGLLPDWLLIRWIVSIVEMTQNQNRLSNRLKSTVEFLFVFNYSSNVNSISHLSHTRIWITLNECDFFFVRNRSLWSNVNTHNFSLSFFGPECFWRRSIVNLDKIDHSMNVKFSLFFFFHFQKSDKVAQFHTKNNQTNTRTCTNTHTQVSWQFKRK